MSDDRKFERTVKRLLAMPPKPPEEMKIGKPRGKRAASPQRKARNSKKKT
jgi:hypothetical protein